jgi:hypothetical protein
MSPGSKAEISEELAVLIRRAERAADRARDLMIENDRLRQHAILRLEYMFKLGTEF